MPIRMKGSEPSPGAEDKRCFQVDIQESNRRIRISTGTRDAVIARTKEQEVLDALRNDHEISRDDLVAIVRGAPESLRTPVPQRFQGMTLKQACDDALRDSLPWGRSRKAWVNSPTLETYRTQLQDIQRILGRDFPVLQVTQATVDTVVNRLLAPDAKTGKPRNAPATVNRKMFALLSVLRRLHERDEMAPKMPKFIPFDESDNARDFVFTPEQEQEVFSALLRLDIIPDGERGGHPRTRDASDYRDLFVFLADVGCRLSAGLAVAWGDIYEEQGQMFVRFFRAKHLKRGKPRTIPLTRRAAEVLRRRRQHTVNGPFETLEKRRAQTLWARAKAQTTFAHETNAVIHAFRHTCATRLLRATGNIKLAQEWLGHSTLETTAGTYARVMVDQKVEALQAFEERWSRPAFPIPPPPSNDR